MARNYGVKSYEEHEEDKRIEKWVGIFIGVTVTCATGLFGAAVWALYF